MESTLQIMPVQRTSRNFGEYAEEAVIIEEPIIKQKRPKILYHVFEEYKFEKA